MRDTHTSNLIFGRNKAMINKLYFYILSSEERDQSRAVASNG